MAEQVIRELTKMAQLVVDEDIDIDSRITAAESYIQEFQVLREVLQNEEIVVEGLRSELDALQEWHSRLIQAVNGLHDKVGDQMRSFRQRAKGIRSYADQMPKMIRITGIKKG